VIGSNWTYWTKNQFNISSVCESFASVSFLNIVNLPNVSPLRDGIYVYTKIWNWRLSLEW
jgi:hypothetical protein